MWVYVGVYAHTYTHCADGVLGCEPRTPGGPEESRWTKSRYTYIRICLQSTHVYVYARRREEILDQLPFPFQNRTAKDVNANH